MKRFIISCLAAAFVVLTGCKEVPEGPVPELEYDYVYEMGYFSSHWYGDEHGQNDENNYYTWLSDIPFTEDDHTQIGGTYYLFDMYGPAPEDEAVPEIPAGTYTLSDYGAIAEWTFSPEYSKAIRYKEYGIDYQAAFSDGTVTVSYDSDGNVVMEAILTDTEGKLHHLTYTGEGICKDDRPAEPGFGEDLEFAASTGVALYSADNGEAMEILMQFTDMDVDAEGNVTPPGSILAVDAIMPFDENGNIATGTYEVSEEGVPMTVYPYDGTYAVKYVSDYEYYASIISGGTMEISGSAGNYTITCDFVASDGFAVKATYSGALEIEGMPGSSFSTLTGDYTLDLAGATAVAVNYGDYYGTGGDNYCVEIMPTVGPDGLLLDLVSDPSVDGIASGTYKVSPSDYPMVGEYLKGFMFGTSIIGTAFVGGFDDQGYMSAYAPATSGDLVITNNGDGTYDISFSFTDDLGNVWGNVWDGEWSGEINVQSGASASHARNRTHVEAPAVRPAAADKAQVLENLGLKIGQPSLPATSFPSGKFVKR